MVSGEMMERMVFLSFFLFSDKKNKIRRNSWGEVRFEFDEISY